jgi:hypothetical protein
MQSATCADERSSQPPAAAAARARDVLLDHSIQIGPGHVQGGRQPEQEARSESQSQRVRQHPKVRAQVEVQHDPRNFGRHDSGQRERDERLERPQRQEGAEQTARDGDQQRSS